MNFLWNENFKKAFFVFIYVLLTWIYFYIFYLLLVSSTTINSFLFSLFFLVLFFIPIIYLIKKFKLKRLFLIIIPILYFIPFFFQKNEEIDGNFELRCIGCFKYNFNPLNIFRENEILNAGFKFINFVGVTNSQVNSFINEFYKYDNRAQINLPSQIPNAFLNIKSKKYFIYKPKNYDKNKAIFVMHGSGGGFLFYLKYFKQFADKNNAILIIPSFGWGNWYENNSDKLIFEVYRDILNKNEIGKNADITLIGLSGGGFGLTRAIYNDENNIFKKIIFISAVFEKGITHTKNFVNNQKNKYIYIIHGKKDDRAYYDDYLKSKSDISKQNELIYNDGDHFIMLNKGQEIINTIQNVINK